MNVTTERSTDANVNFAPRLTEDSLPMTLPKDADKPLENSAGGEQIQTSSSAEDKPVSAGVLDLQLVPQVHGVDLLSTPSSLTHNLGVSNAVTRASNQESAATAALREERRRASFSTVCDFCTCLC